MGIIMTTKELRPRDKNDFYPTPIELCRAALGLLYNWKFSTILDPGSGDGVWGRVAREKWPTAHIEGVDIAPKLDYSYNVIHETDFLVSFNSTRPQYDLVIGNPPYKYAEQFIRKSRSLLQKRGCMVLLLQLAFLEGQKRGEGLWKEFRPYAVHVLSRRPSFTGNCKTDATAYGIYLWRDWSSETTELEWLNWDYDDQST